MCRLFAFVAPGPSAVDRELGARGIHSFISLAQVHGDGWGWAGVPEIGDAPSVHKSVKSAATDPGFGLALAVHSRAAMVHLRWATSGMDVDTANTHPFLANGISFEHNGSLKPVERARELLSAASLREMTGHTDSEMYFALVREKKATGLDLPAATLAAARELRRAFPFSSLNAILLTAEQLIVVHANAHAALTDEDVIEIMKFNLPDEHAEDYFDLRWHRKPDGTIVIGSTGVAEVDWEALPAESVTTITLSDGRTSTARLTSSW
ncbi:MAG TPA: class II glutamine amidotransferase [Glaciibacter sp.]|nr:class II glutamine amidotransferase [Glaciibacter sp.]